MGKIVVIEGTDFSGKTTQYELLKKRLNEKGLVFGTDSFPNYESESSFFVREHLKGTFGTGSDDVDPKVASIFYALDRYASFKMRPWGDIYRGGGNILFSRYITSNVVHQGAKIKDIDAKKEFTEWLYNFETNVLGIPKENVTIFLDMPIDKIIELKKKRLVEQNGLASSGSSVDIYEDDMDFLKRSYENAKLLGKYLNWVFISCVNEKNEIRSIEEINDEIFSIVLNVFNS